MDSSIGYCTIMNKASGYYVEPLTETSVSRHGSKTSKPLDFDWDKFKDVTAHQERPLNSIIVSDVMQKLNVSRSTAYEHLNNLVTASKMTKTRFGKTHYYQFV